MDGILHTYNTRKGYFSFGSKYWSLKFGKAREIKVSNPSETLHYEHLFLEVRRCVLKMCHVLEPWMKYDALRKVKWGQGLWVVQRTCVCMKWQDSELCHPEWRGLWSCEHFYSLWHSIINWAVYTPSQFHFGFTICSWHKTTLMTVTPD